MLDISGRQRLTDDAGLCCTELETLSGRGESEHRTSGMEGKGWRIVDCHRPGGRGEFLVVKFAEDAREFKVVLMTLLPSQRASQDKRFILTCVVLIETGF